VSGTIIKKYPAKNELLFYSYLRISSNAKRRYKFLVNARYAGAKPEDLFLFHEKYLYRNKYLIY